MEKIYFKNSKGNRLCGILSKPANDKQESVIILCHGFNKDKNSDTNRKLKNIFDKNKISVFRFDFFGHGESEGKFENITLSQGVDDAISAINFLKGLGYQKIGLFGSSFGGTVAIITAAKTSALFVLALKSPVSNYLEKYLKEKSKKELDNWKKKGFTFYINRDGKKYRLNYSFFKDFENNNVYQAAKKIKIPTLIVHGDRDEVVSFKQSKKNCQSYKKLSIKNY